MGEEVDAHEDIIHEDHFEDPKRVFLSTLKVDNFQVMQKNQLIFTYDTNHAQFASQAHGFEEVQRGAKELISLPSVGC